MPKCENRDEFNRYIEACHEKLKSRDDLIFQMDELSKAHRDKIESLEKQQADQKAAQDAEVRRLQQSAFQVIKEDRWQPLDDATVNLGLVDIQSSAAQIAKKYALESLGSMKSQPERLEELAKALNEQGVASIKSEGAMVELLAARHSVRICLTSLLSSAIFRLVFGNPFFFMTDNLQEKFEKLPPGFAELRDRGDDGEVFLEYLECILPSQYPSRRPQSLEAVLNIYQSIDGRPICGDQRPSDS